MVSKPNDECARCPDADFIKLFETVGPRQTSRILSLHIKTVYSRRVNLEKLYGRQITAPIANSGPKTRHNVAHPHRIQLNIHNGIVLVGSDAHIWPGPMSTAMRAFIKFCKDMGPTSVILNGDVIDLPMVSRHQRIGWETLPTPQQEIEAAQEVLGHIERATFKAQKIWTLGNHDSRFETRLANVAPEYAKVKGVHLKDHFPAWQAAWSVFINENDGAVVKHRFKSGIHAPHNNTMWAGRTIVTGHLHSAKVYPITDYNGTRYGVDTGCLADTEAKAFVDYTEDSPKSWRSGFCVLSFVDGQLLPPELVSVWSPTQVVFRGQIIEVPHETSAQTKVAPAVAKASPRARHRGRRRVRHHDRRRG